VKISSAAEIATAASAGVAVVGSATTEVRFSFSSCPFYWTFSTAVQAVPVHYWSCDYQLI